MQARLSADWSFACVPTVDDLQDPRNLATAALYAYMLAIALAAELWGILRDWAATGKEAAGRGDEDRQGRNG